MSDAVASFTDGEFASQVLQAEKLTLVDFWAEWCAPCRALAPLVAEIAEAHVNQLNVGKMNIDEHPNTPSQFGVRAIPTLLLFKNGAVVDQLVGLVTKAKIEEMLSRHMKS